MTSLAAKQHQCVTTSQLRSAGLTTRAIQTRTKRGWLVVAHRGVFWVGGPAGNRSYEMAAVLALGKGAFLSHKSAAYFHNLLPYPARHPTRSMDVSVLDRRPDKRAGIKVHRATRFKRGDVRTTDAIPASTPARTLIELASSTPHLLDDAYDEAVFPPRSFKPKELDELIERFAGVKGIHLLRHLHRSEQSNDRSRREGEKRLRSLIASAGLPAPKVNAPIGNHRVDFLCPTEKVVIEMDGFAEHGKRRSFEADRARDAELQAHGYRIIRVTWRQVTTKPNEVIARIAALLAVAAA